LGICILIIDDDRLLVEKLVTRINWDALKIGTVLKANNIRQAMEILEEVPVDIMLCDIEMPQGNGLELLEWVRERQMMVECIFLSSYALFAYAQKAIRLNSYAYLLKPVSNQEIERTLSEIVGKILDKKGEGILKERQKDMTRFWEKILLEKDMDSAMLDEAYQRAIYNPESKLRLVIQSVFLKQEIKKDMILNDFLVENAADQVFGFNSEVNCLKVVVRKSDHIWYLLLEDLIEETDFAEKIKIYRKCLVETLSADVNVYIGEVVPAGQIRDSKVFLEEMVRDAVLDEGGLLYADIWRKRKSDYIMPSWKDWESGMLSEVTLGAVREEILKYIHQVWREQQMTISQLKRFRKELMQMVYSYLIRRDVMITDIFDGSEFDNLYKNSVYTISGADAFVRYIFEKLEGFGSKELEEGSIVEQIKKYIDDHLGEELSRKVLANVVYLSEDYISKVFGVETGMSIPAYVTAKRMQRAQELLKNSKLSVSRIATELGYSNFSYFSKTFRDYTGCTPNEFRGK